MIKLAILLVLATLAVGVSAALLLRLLPALRLQLAGLALLAVILPLAGVLASGWVMFEMRADTEVLAVSSAAALSSLCAALLLARWIRVPLDDLRRASTALAAGDLASRASERGPAEVTEVAHAFNAMADSIERLFEARRELVAWASHDLRTPLASMQAMIEAIDDGLADPREYLPSLAEQVHTLSSLVDDLFELARIDAGVLTQQIERADIERVISSCVRGFEAEARAKGIRLEAPPRGQVPPVRCAPDQVQRVLFNLLTNAIRHTPPGRRDRDRHQPKRARRHDRSRRQRRGRQRRGCGADVRPLLACRVRTSIGRLRTWPRDRPRPRRGARRTDLGRKPGQRRSPNRIHAANDRLIPHSSAPFSHAPGEIRTPDLRFRRPTLYPAELRAQSRQV